MGSALLLALASTRDGGSHLIVRAGGDLSPAVGTERALSWGPAGLVGVEARWAPLALG